MPCIFKGSISHETSLITHLTKEVLLSDSYTFNTANILKFLKNNNLLPLCIKKLSNSNLSNLRSIREYFKDEPKFITSGTIHNVSDVLTFDELGRLIELYKHSTNTKTYYNYHEDSKIWYNCSHFGIISSSFRYRIFNNSIITEFVINDIKKCIKKIIKISPNGKYNLVKVYTSPLAFTEYDHYGNVIRVNDDYIGKYYFKHEYDGNGNVLRDYRGDENGEYKLIRSFKYDDRQNILTKNYHGNSVVSNVSFIYRHDPNGVLCCVEHTTTSSFGNYITYSEFI